MTVALGNPVMTKEMRSRLRGAKGLWLQAAYLFILSVIVAVIYTTWTLSRYIHSAAPSWQTGQLLFRVLSVTQGVLIALIAPALTCGALTLERERQTLDFLLMTPLKSVSIVLGKLLSAFLFMGLLLTLSLPLASVSFLLGGVSPSELLQVYAALVAEAILFCAFGLAWSATFARTTISTPFAYGSVLGFLIGGFVVYGFSMDMGYASRGAGTPVFVFSGVNPLVLPFISDRTVNFFSWRLPVGLPAVVLLFLTAFSVLAVTVHRVATYRGRSHASAARVFIGLAVTAACTALGGDLAVRGGPGGGLEIWATWAVLFVIVVTGLLALLAPTMATGEVDGADSPRRALGKALNPLRVFHGEPPTAAGYLLLLLALTFPSVAGSIASITHPAPAPAKIASTTTRVVVPHAGGPPTRPSTPMWTPAIARAWCWRLVPRLYLLAACALLVYCALGWAVSTVTTNRWIAMGITYALFAAITLIPLTGLSDFDYKGGYWKVHAYGNILYTSPYYAAVFTTLSKGKWEKPPTGFFLEYIASFDKVTVALHLLLFMTLAGLAGVGLANRHRRALARQRVRRRPAPSAPSSPPPPAPPPEEPPPPKGES